MCLFDWDDLRMPMMDSLLMLFNKEHLSDHSLFFDNTFKVFYVLNFWRRYSDQAGLTPATLLDFLIECAVTIVKEIRHKLLFKACFTYKILSF